MASIFLGLNVLMTHLVTKILVNSGSDIEARIICENKVNDMAADFSPLILCSPSFSSNGETLTLNKPHPSTNHALSYIFK